MYEYKTSVEGVERRLLRLNRQCVRGSDELLNCHLNVMALEFITGKLADKTETIKWV